MAILSQRSIALWLLGYPEAALADVDDALKDGREIGQTATLMYALGLTLFTHIFCRNYAAANAEVDELLALADESGALAWKPFGMMHQGSLLALTGQASNAAQIMISGISAWRSTGATMSLPWWLCNLATAYAKLGQFDDAWRCIGEAMTAMETTKERIWEAEANRMAGEIALKSPEPDVAKAEGYFERALTVARGQQAKSWELRAAMSHRTPLARPGQDAAGSRSSRASLRLVHGGVRHARSEGGEGAAAGVGDITGLSGASVGQEDLAVARRSRNHALLWHYRFTAYICQSPGTPLSVWLPRSAKSNPEPATKSLTVLDTSTSPARASEATRAPM